MTAIYFIENTDGHFEGEREWTKRDVLGHILSAEFGKVKKVLEVHEDENRVSDITEDCARELADQFYADREPVADDTRDFLEAHLGLTVMRGLNTVRTAA
jgi:hypothetical protein